MKIAYALAVISFATAGCTTEPAPAPAPAARVGHTRSALGADSVCASSTGRNIAREQVDWGRFSPSAPNGDWCNTANVGDFQAAFDSSVAYWQGACDAILYEWELCETNRTERPGVCDSGYPRPHWVDDGGPDSGLDTCTNPPPPPPGSSSGGGGSSGDGSSGSSGSDGTGSSSGSSGSSSGSGGSFPVNCTDSEGTYYAGEAHTVEEAIALCGGFAM